MSQIYQKNDMPTMMPWMEFYAFASVGDSVVGVNASGSGGRVTFTFYVYFSILFEVIRTSFLQRPYLSSEPSNFILNSI